jgi:hypothetical protein
VVQEKTEEITEVIVETVPTTENSAIDQTVEIAAVEVDEKRIQFSFSLPWKKSVRKSLAGGSKKQTELEQALYEAYLPKVQEKLSKAISAKVMFICAQLII